MNTFSSPSFFFIKAVMWAERRGEFGTVRAELCVEKSIQTTEEA